jgi:transcriptional regulator with XRE-family HTH domain
LILSLVTIFEPPIYLYLTKPVRSQKFIWLLSKTNGLSNSSIGTILRNLRETRNLLLREVAASISIDPTLLSKIERDERMPTREQVKALSVFYKEETSIVLAYLSDKIVMELEDEKLAFEAIKAAEKKLKEHRI